MKKRVLSCVLVIVMLFALLPATTARAAYGTRAKQAWQYIMHYIQQHGVGNGGVFDGVESKTIREVLQSNNETVELSLGNWVHTWTIQLFFDYENPTDPFQMRRQTISLQFVENYWQEDDSELYQSGHVQGAFSYRQYPDGSPFQTQFRLVPSRFPNSNAASFFNYPEVSEEELEAYRQRVFDLEQDLLDILDRILREGGYTVADLGFANYEGHKTHKFWGDGKTLAPTCTTDGYERGKCYVCGTVVDITIPATGHEWQENEPEVAPTCTESGSRNLTCSVCGEETIEEIPALGHAWKLTQTLTTEENLHESTGQYTCIRCGETKETRLCAAEIFTDMPEEGNWAHHPIDWAYFKGITAGKTATTFLPKDSCTRAEVVTFLWAAADKPEPEEADCPFTDVKPSAFYYKAMIWAVNHGITSGKTPTTFAPKAVCSRAEVVTFLWAAAGRPEPRTEENPFTDVTETSWYYKAVLWALENGITGGTGPTSFSPKNNCTRAQVVTFLYKASLIPPIETPETP